MEMTRRDIKRILQAYGRWLDDEMFLDSQHGLFWAMADEFLKAVKDRGGLMGLEHHEPHETIILPQEEDV